MRCASALAVGLLCGAWLAGAPVPVRAELHVWVDAEGRTHVTDDPAKIPPEARERATTRAVEIRGLWDDGITGPPVQGGGTEAGTFEGRVQRILRGALDDLARGETARAQAALGSVLEWEPDRPEAHWYLALLEWQRGHLDSSEAHLRAFLGSAGDRFEPWRRSAPARLARRDDERRLRDRAGKLELVAFSSPHFRLQVDAELSQAGAADLAPRVLGYLDEARRDMGERLGIVPQEPTGVVLYGKAAYLRAHRHRFSFQTVGFYDGRIHVVSAAHPAGELRSLLFHEYSHALFREGAGSDRPFWLNEGLAELAERRSQGRPPLSRTDRARLRDADVAGEWLPLSRLAPSFAGLDQEQARLAYLEATAAADWIEGHSQREARARLIRLLGTGEAPDAALRSTLGLDTAGLDAAVRQDVAARFAGH